MAIRVKSEQNIIGQELMSKFGALGIEIVVDQEDKKILNPLGDEFEIVYELTDEEDDKK